MSRNNGVVCFLQMSKMLRDNLLDFSRFLGQRSNYCIFASKRYLDFNKLSVYTCNKLFDTLFLPILLYGSEIWGAYDNINIKTWEKDPVERLHTVFEFVNTATLTKLRTKIISYFTVIVIQLLDNK